MSRNKIIKMVHDYTGAKYAACRRFCKKYNWDYVKIYRMINLFDADAVNDLTAAFDNLKAAICEAGKTIAGIAAEICASYNEAIMRDQLKPLSIDEMRAQMGLKPIDIQPIDVNDPHTPVFVPYYAQAIPNGKLYQNNGGRNTDETGA